MQSRCSKNLSFEIGEKLGKLLKVEMRSREKTSDMGHLGERVSEKFQEIYFSSWYKNFIFCQVA